MPTIESYCGILCSKCAWKDKVKCPGCIACKGVPFHGNCRVAMCCLAKKLEHCGQCDQFPCEVLIEFAYDKEHGDNGTRIGQLKIWKEA
jgi:hypothetical protein